MSRIPAKVALRDSLIYVKTDSKYNSALKKTGFAWDKRRGLWCTPFTTIAKKLFPESKSVKALEDQRAKAKAKKRALPRPAGLKFRPFQKEGIKHLITYKDVLLADEQGLGKTVQAAGAINKIDPEGPILIICPASLKLNWARELKKWLVKDRKIQVLYGKTVIEKADIYIMNYDIALQHYAFMHYFEWDIVIFDEAQYLKNPTAQRTQLILGKKGREAVRAKRKWALTGTPILNRPIEMFEPLRYLCPLGFPAKAKFASRYCAAHFDSLGYYDDKGSSNEEELNALLHEFLMIRRLKEDVLTELPAKERQFIYLEDCAASKAEKKIIGKMKVDNITDFLTAIKGKFNDEGEHLATVRRKTGLAKFAAACDQIDSYIEAGEKLVVFAIHTELIAKLSEKYKGVSVTITGSTSAANRDKNVQAFQNDKAVKVFFGNIQAAGVGITLTSASNAMILELPWSPSEVAQAEDRLHRISQKNAVLVKYLIFEGTIDALISKQLGKKSKVIKSILD